MRHPIVVALSLALAAGVMPVRAQNLLANPDFDQAPGLTGWTWDGGGDGSQHVRCTGSAACGNVTYANSECCARPTSGAAASRSSFFNIESLTQCVDAIVPGQSYDYGAWMHVTTAVGPEPGLPYVSVTWYGAAACAGTALSSGAERGTDSAAWTRVAVSGMTAPEGTVSAKFLLIMGPTGDAGSSVGMEFDSAFFGPSGSVPVELQSFDVE